VEAKLISPPSYTHTSSAVIHYKSSYIVFISTLSVHGGRIIWSLQPPHLHLLLICLFSIHRTILVETFLTACAIHEFDLVLTSTDSDHYKPLVQCKDNTIHHCYRQSDTHQTILILHILLNYKLLYSFYQLTHYNSVVLVFILDLFYVNDLVHPAL
jgi:hypothetical protein